ncbi:MAG: ThuA domain-containing protein [Halanaerobiales bacterium]
MEKKIKVTVWNEFRHEKDMEECKEIYPEGMHTVIAEYLQGLDMNVKTATLDEPEHGLTSEVLEDTDVLIWWGHCAHEEVVDEIVERVHHRVLSGMGLIVLHSGHFSRIFKKLMGTSCDLKWRCADEKERLWIVKPGHPIVKGLNKEYIELPEEEMYGEFFDIPEPDELIFISWFEGGEVFRSGCTFSRGNGKIFYFRPGHETNPSYYNKDVMKVIANAVKWAADNGKTEVNYGNVKSLEEL